MQLEDVLLTSGENSPLMQPSLSLHQQMAVVGHGVLSYGHSTISLPCLSLTRYKQRVNNMNKLMIWFQCWAGSADGAVIV
jgi:hypothetical protein